MSNVTAKMAGLSEERHKKGRGRRNLTIKDHHQIVQKTTTVAVQRYNKRLCKEKKNQKSDITMEVGGWVQVSLGISFV